MDYSALCMCVCVCVCVCVLCACVCSMHAGAFVCVLTIKVEAGVLEAQPVGGHAGVVPVVLLGNVGDHEDGVGAQGLYVDGLRVG